MPAPTISTGRSTHATRCSSRSRNSGSAHWMSSITIDHRLRGASVLDEPTDGRRTSPRSTGPARRRRSSPAGRPRGRGRRLAERRRIAADPGESRSSPTRSAARSSSAIGANVAVRALAAHLERAGRLAEGGDDSRASRVLPTPGAPITVTSCAAALDRQLELVRSSRSFRRPRPTNGVDHLVLDLVVVDDLEGRDGSACP